jgi:peptidylprolyl isomerase/peptidyl-prolyl cis-trans isomerase B (cyclophilin B)
MSPGSRFKDPARRFGRPDSALRGANGAAMTTYEKPTGDELSALAAEAKTLHARIHTDKGDIVFAFYPDEAPQHCAAFVKLARAGFYDGLTFHRVESGFVIQGGDPSGNGTGGPGYQIDAEFSNLPHIKGTVAMARSANPNSAGSQFYICLDDASSLNKQYTVFGQTVAGQDVVDKIRKGDVMETVRIEAAG